MNTQILPELSLIKEPKPEKVQIWLLDTIEDWPASMGTLPDWIQPGEEKKATCFWYNSNGSRQVVAFLQKNEAESCRKAGAQAQTMVATLELKEVKVWSNVGNTDLVLAFIEGFSLSSYRFDKYKSKKATPCKSIQIWHPLIDKKQLKQLEIICQSVAMVRHLVNEPASNLTAKKLADTISKIGEEYGFEVEVLGKNKIQSLKMGGLLGVNKGSTQPPTFSILEYKPKNAHNKQPIVLVGKGVVYDTGGHSLKTSAGMEAMKCDMAGAATVIGVFQAISALHLPLHVIGLIPATDNRISADAISPGDILTMASGTTVEVLNTDAEGRLILADALYFAQRYKPSLVLDFATLTGAAARAIGKEGYVYLGTAETEVKEKVKKAGESVYERGVEFPIWEEYQDYLKSDVADLKNIGGADAGAITAGMFLKHFTSYPWLHFDIAGVAFLEGGGYGYVPKGATGNPVRMVVELLKDLSQS